MDSCSKCFASIAVFSFIFAASSLSNLGPQLDEFLAEQQQAIYAVAGVNESESAVPVKTKRKKVYMSNEGAEDVSALYPCVCGRMTDQCRNLKPRRNCTPATRTARRSPERTRPSTNLPLDTSESEIIEVFSKYGVISEEIDTGKPRIKLYRNEDGTPKGDALVIYFRPESVNLAINMLDDSPFRIG